MFITACRGLLIIAMIVVLVVLLWSICRVSGDAEQMQEDEQGIRRS